MTRFQPWTKQLVVTAIIGGFLLLASVICQRMFHTSEIHLLIEKADEQKLSYELIIHNSLTNAYSFDIIDD